MPTTEQLVAAYVKLRDQKKELTDMHKDQLAPFNHKLAVLEAALLDQLNKTGAESIRSNAGTAYKITRRNVKIEDWRETLDFILANNLTHMLEKRLAKSSVDEFIEANGEAPPGVSISSNLTVGIRRS